MSRSTVRLLRYVAPLSLAALVACQSAPASPPGVARATPTPEVGATPTPEAAGLPAGEPVTLGAVTDQTVLVNQVGYLPTLPKVAVVSGSASASTFQVVDTQSRRSVFSAALSEPLKDVDTGQVLRKADFSRVTESGTYTLVVPGVGRSPEFRIAADVYQQLSKDALDSYEQLALNAPKAWQAAAAIDRQSGRAMDVTGGWPDAGDYGRYMPSAASALGTLLLVNDLAPEKTQADSLTILKRELDWILKMQRSDGAVFHKVTPLNFGGFDKGSDNIGGQLYAFDASTPDAAVFAAITAQAARVYAPTDAAYAARLRSAAEQSWRWLVEQQKPMLPPEMEGTGAYVYGSDSSQRFWAAAELYRTTGEPTYWQFVSAYLARRSPAIGPLGWTNTDTYALLSLAFNNGADPALRAQVASKLTQWADGMATSIDNPTNPWATSVSAFHWASNKKALDNAVLLLLADRITPTPRYVSAALDQLHFVLGRNALARSFVTGYGANSVKNPHNRTMFSIGHLIPGVLVGGPNADGQDGVTPKASGQRSYVDQLMAYASNENSVEYNAPLVFVTSLLSAGAY